jgi:hypothetical protein
VIVFIHLCQVSFSFVYRTTEFEEHLKNGSSTIGLGEKSVTF